MIDDAGVDDNDGEQEEEEEEDEDEEDEEDEEDDKNEDGIKEAKEVDSEVNNELIGRAEYDNELFSRSCLSLCTCSVAILRLS